MSDSLFGLGEGPGRVPTSDKSQNGAEKASFRKTVVHSPLSRVWTKRFSVCPLHRTSWAPPKLSLETCLWVLDKESLSVVASSCTGSCICRIHVDMAIYPGEACARAPSSMIPGRRPPPQTWLALLNEGHLAGTRMRSKAQGWLSKPQVSDKHPEPAKRECAHESSVVLGSMSSLVLFLFLSISISISLSLSLFLLHLQRNSSALEQGGC